MPARCPKCQGKLPSDLTPVNADANSSINEELLCPSCLGRIQSKLLGEDSRCPICGHKVSLETARELTARADDIVTAPTQRLLAGESVNSIVSSLQGLGIGEEQAWRYVDRLIAELPFERYKHEQAGKTAQLAPTCDSCGLSEELSLYDGEWELDAREMNRYRKGYAGFDGKFADHRSYSRPAVYCLCKRCYKRSGKEDFANGYPAQFGYVLKRLKLRKDKKK